MFLCVCFWSMHLCKYVHLLVCARMCVHVCVRVCFMRDASPLYSLYISIERESLAPCIVLWWSCFSRLWACMCVCMFVSGRVRYIDVHVWWVCEAIVITALTVALNISGSSRAVWVTQGTKWTLLQKSYYYSKLEKVWSVKFEWRRMHFCDQTL